MGSWESRWGKTTLQTIKDHDSELAYIYDLEMENCTIIDFSNFSEKEEDYPASDMWVHGGIISMRDPEVSEEIKKLFS